MSSEQDTFGSAELATLETGRAAMASLQKTIHSWMAVGEAIKVLREKADRIGTRKAFGDLMDRNGFSMKGQNRVIDQGTVTHLLNVLVHKDEVLKWHAGLPPTKQRQFSAPNTIKKHCPVFAPQGRKTDPDAPVKLTPAQKDRAQLVVLNEEVKRLEDELRTGGDSTWAFGDTAKDIGKAIYANMVRRGLALRKIEDAGKEITRLARADQRKQSKEEKTNGEGDQAQAPQV